MEEKALVSSKVFKRSICWQAFQKESQKSKVVYCRFCKPKRTFSSSSSTSRLLKHAWKFHPEEMTKALANKSAPVNGQSNDSTFIDEEDADSNSERPKKARKKDSFPPYQDPPRQCSETDLMQLIEFVREAPILYNGEKQGDDAELWDEIAAKMGRYDMSGSDWKKQWEFLCKRYATTWRNLEKNSMSGTDLEAARLWNYFTPLRFLKPYLEAALRHYEDGDEHNDEGNYENDEDESDEPNETENDMKESWDTIRFANTSQWSVRGSRSMPNKSSGVSRSNFHHLPRESDDTFSSPESPSHRLLFEMFKEIQTLKHAHKEERRNQTNVDFYFNSCKKRMQQLDQRTQSVLQMQISQLFFNAENPDLPPRTIIPLPRKQTSVVGSQTETFSNMKRKSISSQTVSLPSVSTVSSVTDGVCKNEIVFDAESDMSSSENRTCDAQTTDTPSDYAVVGVAFQPHNDIHLSTE